MPSSVVEFAQSELDVTETESDEALRALLKSHLKALRNQIAAPVGVIRLILTGTPKRHWQILRDRDVWIEQVNELAQATGDLWIDKLLFDLPPPDATEGASGAADELATIMATIRGEPGFAALARDEVETVLQELPVTLRDRLLPDEAARDAMVDKLTKAGADVVLAQMKGAGH